MSANDAVLATLKQLSKDYAALREYDAKRPALELVAFTITTTKVPKAAPGQGWVREASALFFCAGGEPLDQPLHGEWLAGDSTTLLLRADVPVPGEVSAWTFAERPLPEAGALAQGEHPALRETLTLLQSAGSLQGTRKRIMQDREKTELPALQYHLYWGADANDPSGIRRIGYRFAGLLNAAGLVIAPPRLKS